MNNKNKIILALAILSISSLSYYAYMRYDPIIKTYDEVVFSKRYVPEYHGSYLEAIYIGDIPIYHTEYYTDPEYWSITISFNATRKSGIKEIGLIREKIVSKSYYEKIKIGNKYFKATIK